VVNKGKCDKVFINISGIGRISKEKRLAGKAGDIKPGDVILINGALGEHGMAVMECQGVVQFQSSADFRLRLPERADQGNPG